MRVIFGCCMLLFVSLLCIPVYAGGPLAIFDNFTGKTLNPDKWYGYEWNQVGASRENVRQIQSNALRLLTRGYGLTGSSSGTNFGANQLRFANPGAITAIKATIQLKEYELTGCTSNPDSSGTRVRARLAGFFFNTATPTPGSAVNDVLAIAAIQRKMSSTDPANVFRVMAYVVHCKDQDCNVSSDLGSADLGTISVGEKTTLRIEWNKAKKKFLAQRGKQAEVSMSYTVSDNSPAGLGYKLLETSYYLANCEERPRPTGFMDAIFDNVYVNKSAMASVGETTSEDSMIFGNTPIADVGP